MFQRKSWERMGRWEEVRSNEKWLQLSGSETHCEHCVWPDKEVSRECAVGQQLPKLNTNHDKLGVTSHNTHIAIADSPWPVTHHTVIFPLQRTTPNICDPQIMDIPRPDPVSPYSKVSHFLIFSVTAFSPYGNSPYKYAPASPYP